jgi:glycosyltransferase involved in cell wall biosynthesis
MTSESGRYRYLFVRFEDSNDGHSESGVQRYGRKLYERVVLDSDAEELAIDMGDGQAPETKLLGMRPTAGTRLIVQISPHFYFRECIEIACRLARFAKCNAPHLVVIHDAKNLPKPVARWRPGEIFRAPKAFATALKRGGSPARFLVELVDAGFVLSVFHRYQLRHLPAKGARSARVVPHFVELPRSVPSNDTAKAELGLEGRYVLTILGYLNPRKGNETAIAALERLPSTYVLVFAGGGIPGKSYKDELEMAIQSKGLSDRVRITGHLSDTQQSIYIAATDLALCVFKRMSASGSLSTWISYGKRILGAELPEMLAYNQIAPGALSIWRGDRPSALAEEIVRLCEHRRETEQKALQRLRQELSIERVWGRLSA